MTEETDYIEQEDEVETDFKGPSIIRREFDIALEQLKYNKAAGPDLMISKLLKNADEKVKKIIYEKIQYVILQEIYQMILRLVS